MAYSINVLHIDTEPNNGGLTAAALNREVDHVVVETATSATEGLDIIVNRSPDCVLSTPDILSQNGTDFIQQVRNEDPELPFILLTTDVGTEVVNEAVSAGVTDYFQTTSEPEQYQLLINRIENIVQSRQSTERLAHQKGLVELTELTASVGGWELDLESDELNITTGASQITGLPQDADLSQAESVGIYHPDDRPEVQAAVDRSAQTGQQVQDTWRIQPASGSQRVIDVTITPDISNGEVTTLRGTIQDVTERYERRRELEQIETLFQHTQGPLFLIGVGDEFTVRRVNQAWEDATGVPADSAPGQTLGELLGEDQGSEVEQRYRTCVQREEPLEYEEQLQFDDAPTYWKTRIAPVMLDGDVKYIAGSTQNITEIRKQQRELRIFQQAINNTEVPITLSDPSQEDNPLVYVNDAYEQLTGYSEKEALGRNCRFLQGKDTDPEPVTALRTSIDAQDPNTVEFRNYRKDDTEFWNRLTVVPIYNDDGTLIRYLGTQQDITERKKREKHLELLERVWRHNLRNIMNMVRGWAEVICAEASKSVTTNGKKIVEMSNELLELTEKERKLADVLRGEPIQKPLDIEAVLERVVSKTTSEYPEATIATKCPTKMTVRTTVDLEQALNELVTNAIVHNDSESSEVDVTATRGEIGVRIEIADNGPQIPEMERGILTDGVKEEPLRHGSGLGMWLVRESIVQVGGSITAETRSPTGNIITVVLPQ
ncbi:PAS domain S-box protein [Halorubrum sp. RMP-47]|uniref:histidine kinase n=1 Tax=Halorubrum miltondacostae TaxID=3076378 RepID=A0ABD5M3S3_9EURY